MSQVPPDVEHARTEWLGGVSTILMLSGGAGIPFIGALFLMLWLAIAAPRIFSRSASRLADFGILILTLAAWAFINFLFAKNIGNATVGEMTAWYAGTFAAILVGSIVLHRRSNIFGDA